MVWILKESNNCDSTCDTKHNLENEDLEIVNDRFENLQRTLPYNESYDPRVLFLQK
jgi:hypothetical protein